MTPRVAAGRLCESDESQMVTEASDRVEGRLIEAKGTNASGGRIFGVRVIAYGDSRNGRRYPESVMRNAARLYEGAKAYDHHRNEAELATSTILGLVGSYRHVVPSAEGIDAELHLLPGATHTAEALDASLAAQAAGLRPLVGISHDVMALYRPLVTGGKRLQEATEIISVNSADVVADPAAGGRPTRMVAGGSDDTNSTTDPEEGPQMNLKQLLELLRAADTQRRSELIVEHAELLKTAGLSGEEAIALVATPDPVGDPEPEGDKVLVTAGAAGQPEGATEAVLYAKSTLAGRRLIRDAMADKGIDERLYEAIVDHVPDRFAEGDLMRSVESATRMAEHYEKANLAPREPHVAVTKDEADKKRERLDKMFAGDFTEGYRSFKEAFIDFTGYDTRKLFATDSEDFNRVVLRESIGTADPFDSASRSTESATTSTWNLALGDSITRRLVAMYRQPSLQTWRTIVSSTPPVNDFRTQRIDRIGGYGVLPVVNQGAPYQPLTTPSNEEVTYALTKKGGTEDLTLETIANDDLRVIVQIPQKLGLAAAQTLYRFVFDLLDTNPTIYDASALFVAGHSNTATTALSGSNLSAARKAMRKQTAYGDSTDVLSIVPRTLIVVSDLEELGFQVTRSAVALPAAAPVGAPADQPNLHQGMDYLTIDYWTSTTKWIVVADPTMVPTIEVGFYQGRQDPELFVQNDPTQGAPFNADKVVWKIRHVYSGAVLDYRGFYRGNV